MRKYNHADCPCAEDETRVPLVPRLVLFAHPARAVPADEKAQPVAGEPAIVPAAHPDRHGAFVGDRSKLRRSERRLIRPRARCGSFPTRTGKAPYSRREKSISI